MSEVLLPWVVELPWKWQSILISGLRAPDMKTAAVKKVCRWMRAKSQNNADPSKGYMESQEFGDARAFIETMMNELEYLPCHYVHHFADALRVIGIGHPEENVREFANAIHEEVAQEIFHFHAETIEEFKIRHRDRRDACAECGMEVTHTPDCSILKLPRCSFCKAIRGQQEHAFDCPAYA